MLSRIWFLFFPFFLILNSLHAQVFHDQAFRTTAEKGLGLTYNFEFEVAEKTFSQLKKQYASHPGPDFLLAINRWWQSYISTSEEYHEYIETHLKSSIKLNEKLKGQVDYELEYAFFQYMGFAFLTRLYILRREWGKAANTGRKALPYLTGGLKFAKESPEFYFSAGIYHYYAEVYPQNHYYVRPFTIFFPEGDAEKGLKELEFASNTPNFTRTESLYYLGDIYLEEEKEYAKALTVKQKLAEEYPHNTWFKADFARALIYAEKASKAEPILAELIQNFEEIEKHDSRQVSSSESLYTSFLMMRVYNYMGKVAYFHKRNYQHAVKYFDLSLKMGEIAHMDIDAHLAISQYYLGRAYDKLGNKTKANKAYKKALDMDENREIKSLAEACLKNNCAN